MRTKNAKRLWPVPVTLGVMALAALLAFGLMATTGAQPAAAQDADCTITINSTNAATNEEISIADTDSVTSGEQTDLSCDAMGDMATIKLVGPAGNPPTTDPINVYLLVEDKSGALSFYANDDVWVSVDGTVINNIALEKGDFADTDGMIAKPTRYGEFNVEVPRAVRKGGLFERQSATLTVGGAGKVHLYLPADYDTDIVEKFADTDCSPECDPDAATNPTSPPNALKFTNAVGAVDAQPDGDSSTIAITFLGLPAIGKDSDNDRNKIIDDFMQCTEDAADTDEDFDDATLNEDGIEATCTLNGSSDTVDTADTPETRSKLLGIKGSGLPANVINADAVTALIDGKTAEIELTDDTDTSATVFVVLEDADGDPLDDTDVDFEITSQPSNVFTSSRTVGTGTASTDASNNVPGINAAADDDPADAIAMRVIDNLPTDHGFRISVKVTSAGVDIGTMIITRHGDAETLKAATFNMACLDDVVAATGDDPADYGPAMVDLDNKNCAETTRFGVGDVIVVKSHLEDSLGTVTAGDIDVELADDFDDPLSADDPTDKLDQAVAANVNPVAFVYVVDEDAQLGDHMITVSTDEDDVEDVTLTVQVAGPPASYSIGGPMYIPLGGSGTYTVTAMDKEMGIPALTTEAEANDDNPQNDLVEVYVQGLVDTPRGVDSNDMLMLAEDTGMGSFTIYAPRDAEQGEVIRIFVSEGDTEVELPIMFGMMDADPGMDDELTAPMGADASLFGGSSIIVRWDPGSAQNADLIVVALFNEGVTALADVPKSTHPINLDAMDDPGTYSFDNVPSGTYKVAVASERDGEYKVNFAPEVVTVP